MDSDALAQQIQYYDARADEYDDFWFRRGDYSLAEPLASHWRHDTGEVLGHLRSHLPADGSVLELAAGTGILTEVIAAQASQVHAIDASEAMLRVNAARTGLHRGIFFERADLFAWTPIDRYDAVVFGFWLSHVPDDRLTGFWDLVRHALRPGGRAIFIDSQAHPGSDGPLSGSHPEPRKLRDGRSFEVVKRYWTTDELTDDLTQRGWQAEVSTSRHGLILCGVARYRD